MVSTLGISFLCCVALTAAVPRPPLRPDYIPSNADFDIIVITIDEPASSESNATDRGTFYDDVISQFFNFQLPAFPGFRQYFSDENLFEVETPENGPEVVTGKLPEVVKHEPAKITISPVVESPVTTESSTQYIVQGPGLNFGLTNLLSSMVNSVLSGFAETMQQYKFVTPDVESDQPNLETLADEPKVTETSEIEKKIERLFLENNEKDNDLKHGGAKKSSPHTHEFLSAKNSENVEATDKKVNDAAVDAPPSKSERPANEEPSKLSSAERSELEFDQKIMKLLASFEDGIPVVTVVEKPSEIVADKDVLSLSPETKTARNVETVEDTDPAEAVEFLSRFAREHPGAAICEESTDVPLMFNGEPETTTKDVPFFGEESEESTEPAVSTENPYFYVPQGEEESSEFFGSDSYIFVPRYEEAHYELPPLTTDIILIPASQLSRKSHQDHCHSHPVIPDFGHGYPAISDLGHGYAAIPDFGHSYAAVPDFAPVPNFGRSLPAGPNYGPRYNYPVMAAVPHPYAPYLWPQPAPFHPHPFEFLGPQHAMPALPPVFIMT